MNLDHSHWLPGLALTASVLVLVELMVNEPLPFLLWLFLASAVGVVVYIEFHRPRNLTVVVYTPRVLWVHSKDEMATPRFTHSWVVEYRPLPGESDIPRPAEPTPSFQTDIQVAVTKGLGEEGIEEYLRKTAKRYGYHIVSLNLREGKLRGRSTHEGDIIIES